MIGSIEAEKMVLALPDDYNPALHDLDSELLRGIGRMTRENAPFDDGNFREMLENAIARTVFPSYSDRPPDMGNVIPSVLPEDVMITRSTISMSCCHVCGCAQAARWTSHRVV